MSINCCSDPKGRILPNGRRILSIVLLCIVKTRPRDATQRCVFTVMFSLKGVNTKKKSVLTEEPKNLSNKNVFHSESESESDYDKKVLIETVEVEPNEKPKVIIPSKLSAVLPGQSESDSPEPELNQPKSPETQLEEISVDEFGAAMLRGMGWKPKPHKIIKTNVAKRKQGLLLGIGAQEVANSDAAEELLSSKAKFSIPIVKRDKRTGQIVKDPTDET